MDAGAHDILGQAALGEKFLEQCIVALGDVLDQLLVQPGDLVLPAPLGRLLLVFARPVGGVADHLAAEHVEHLVKTRAGIHGHLHRKHRGTEAAAHLRQQPVEIHPFLVEAGHDDDLRNAVGGGVFPHQLRADADAVAGVDHHEGEVGDVQRVDGLAAEIEVTGRVDEIETPPLPFAVERRAVDRDVPLLLAHVVIRDRGALGDGTHAMDGAAAQEHGLGQHRLAGGRMAHEGEVSDLSRSLAVHGMGFLVWFRPGRGAVPAKRWGQTNRAGRRVKSSSRA